MLGFGRRKARIQATEGAKSDVSVEDGITWARSTSGIQGTSNQYLTYGAQVEETYRKYRGQAAWGCGPVRTVVDTRAAFIAGEGLAVASDDGAFVAWVKGFLKESGLGGPLFFESVIGSEMAGRALYVLSPRPGEYPSVVRYPYSKANAYEVGPDRAKVGDSVYGPERFTYIRTAGDDAKWEDTPARVGLALTDCENYDRALKDIRRTNHMGSRITPQFLTEDDNETAALKANLASSGWKAGQAYIGTAPLTFVSATVGALENLREELAANAKNISALTGVPVHWLGHTDLMSNRATAEDMYQMIGNATSRERALFAEGMRELIAKAQVMYLDSGGTMIRAVNRDFTVTIPSIDYGKFESMVRALSVAYQDEAISIEDYRSFIPGIDPLETKKAVEEARARRPKAADPFALASLNDGQTDQTGGEE